MYLSNWQEEKIKKASKDTDYLKNTINKLEQIDIYKTLQLMVAFFSRTPGSLVKMAEK